MHHRLRTQHLAKIIEVYLFMSVFVYPLNSVLNRFFQYSE